MVNFNYNLHFRIMPFPAAISDMKCKLVLPYRNIDSRFMDIRYGILLTACDFRTDNTPFNYENVQRRQPSACNTESSHLNITLFTD